MSENENAIAVQSKPGTLTVFDEEMARMAKATAEKETVAGRFLSVKGGRFALAGESLPAEIKVVIVASAFENDYYPGAYNPDDTSPPTCYAIETEEEDLKPHVESVDPQSPACFGCPHNAWGSAGPGKKGKGCQNRRRLALIAESDVPTAEKAELVYFRLPVTSVRQWALYVKGLAGIAARPPFAVLTKIRLDPHPKHQFEVKFEYVASLSQDDVQKVMRRMEEQVSGGILFPYPKATAKASSPRSEKY